MISVVKRGFSDRKIHIFMKKLWDIVGPQKVNLINLDPINAEMFWTVQVFTTWALKYLFANMYSSFYTSAGISNVLSSFRFTHTW